MTELAREPAKWVAARKTLTSTTYVHHNDAAHTERLNKVYYEPTTADETLLTGTLTGQLEKLYGFGSDLVERFLEYNPTLISLLFDAHGAIRTYFGPDVDASLEIVEDPEALGDQQLFILIRSGFARSEARARLAELDRGWWLDILPTAEGKLEIALA